MLKTLHEVPENLHRTGERGAAAAAHVAEGTEELKVTAQQLSQRSIEAMTASTQQNADKARQTEKIATSSAHDAKDSGVAVAHTVKAVTEIATRSGFNFGRARQSARRSAGCHQFRPPGRQSAASSGRLVSRSNLLTNQPEAPELRSSSLQPLLGRVPSAGYRVSNKPLTPK
jgi:hypothetical protein